MRLFTAACLSLLLVTSAPAGSIVDQRLETGHNAGQNVFLTNVLAQTFTVGIEGRLTGVDILVYGETGLGAGEILTVQLRDSVGGHPGAAVLASGEIPGSAVSNALVFVHVDFPAPGVAVKPGDVLALVFVYPVAFGIGVPLFGLGGAYPDPYAGGSAWASADDTVWAPALAAGMGQDRLFRTYVDPVRDLDPTAEINALILDLNAAIAGSGGAKWAKKLAAAVKGAEKAIAELMDNDAIGAVKALGKVAKSIAGAGAKGFADAADLAERAAFVAAYLADDGVDVVLPGGDPDDVAKAVGLLEAGHALLVAGDHAGAIGLYAKAAKAAEKAV